MDVKDLEARIHENEASYAIELEKSVPLEFRDMVVLFEQSLLESWYLDVLQHMPFWQIKQPFQLFAQLYREYDHYWQFEMDLRITQHVGNALEAFHEFGRKQPRKQSPKRASWSYMPSLHGDYATFTRTIDAAMGNTAGIWGPVKIKKVVPIGPKPPTRPTDSEEAWEWGKREDVDLLLLSPMTSVFRMQDWPFSGWYFGFRKAEIPWGQSTGAQGRASWNLLNAIHYA